MSADGTSRRPRIRRRSGDCRDCRRRQWGCDLPAFLVGQGAHSHHAWIRPPNLLCRCPHVAPIGNILALALTKRFINLVVANHLSRRNGRCVPNVGSPTFGASQLGKHWLTQISYRMRVFYSGSAYPCWRLLGEEQLQLNRKSTSLSFCRVMSSIAKRTLGDVPFSDATAGAIAIGLGGGLERPGLTGSAGQGGTKPTGRVHFQLTVDQRLDEFATRPATDQPTISG
jgi:hypothetical protein